MTWADFATISPIVAAIAVAGAILIVDLIKPGDRDVAIVTSLIGLAVVTLFITLVSDNPGTAFNGAYRQDALTTFLDLLFVSIVALTLLFAPD